jgi:isopenicillin N synthase-like dioxygenase
MEPTVKIECNSIVDMRDSAHNQHLFASLRDNRFAIIKNPPVNLDDLDYLYQDWEKFFAKNIAEKEKYLYSIDNDDGYVPLNIEHARDTDKPDLKEFYQIHLDSLLHNDNPCSDRTKQKFLQIAQLGEYLIKNIDQQLPEEVRNSMSTSLSQAVEQSKRHCMRFIHYPPCDDTTDLYRSAPHDDICLLTIIFPTRGEGLIMKKNTGWQEETPNGKCLVVFNSEMLEVCTQGYFKSMTHHVTTDLVQNARSVSRYSMPFFVHPQSAMLLKESLSAGAAVKQRIIETGLDKIK